MKHAELVTCNERQKNPPLNVYPHKNNKGTLNILLYGTSSQILYLLNKERQAFSPGRGFGEG